MISFPRIHSRSYSSSYPNYKQASTMMKQLKFKFEKLVSAGINIAWIGEPAQVPPEYVTRPNNISYMVMELYDDEDCMNPVMQAGKMLIFLFF